MRYLTEGAPGEKAVLPGGVLGAPRCQTRPGTTSLTTEQAPPMQRAGADDRDP